MIKRLEEIVDEASKRGKRRLVIAYGQDSHSIESADMAIKAAIAEVTLVGDRSEIERVCASDGIDSSRFSIIDCSGDVKCVETAVRMINEGKADVLMKGLVSTDKYMHGILSKEFGLLPPKSTLSHVAVLELPTYHKLLLMSDVAVIPYPDFDQKKAIVKYLIQTAKSLGIEVPKVACMAPSEQLLPKVPSSTEAALLACMGRRGQFGDKVDIDGPLSLDVAIDAESAKTKNVDSSVAGDADCLLFPNLDAGNAFFKCCTKFCGAKLAAMVVGTKVPCVLTSRGDSTQSKLYSIALACLSVK